MPTQERHTIKECTCGETYTREEWQKLRLTVKYGGRARWEDGFTYEFRHCGGCSSTLAITVREQAQSQPSVAPIRRPISQPPLDVAASSMLRVSSSDK